MDICLNYITLMITNMTVYMIFLDFFTTRYERIYSAKVYGIFIILISIISAAINILNLPLLNLMLTICVFIILNTVLFAIKVKKDILVNMTFLIVLLMLEIVIFLLIEYFTNIDDVVSNTFMMNIKMITASLLQFVIYNLLKNYFLNKNLGFLKRQEITLYVFTSIMSLIISGCMLRFASVENNMLRVLFLVLVICITMFNVFIIKIMESVSKAYELENEVMLIQKSSQMTFSHYKQMEEREKQTSLILHDIKNHLTILQKSIESSSVENNVYLNDIKDSITKLSNHKIASRKILNVLLNEKISEISKWEIKLEFDDNDLDLEFISDFNIITIFSNILDNAIYAVKNLPKEDRVIELYIKKVNDLIIIREKNKCLNPLVKTNGMIVSNKTGHKGLGLMSIENILKNYDGIMVTEIDTESKFNITILVSA